MDHASSEIFPTARLIVQRLAQLFRIKKTGAISGPPPTTEHVIHNYLRRRASSIAPATPIRPSEAGSGTTFRRNVTGSEAAK